MIVRRGSLVGMALAALAAPALARAQAAITAEAVQQSAEHRVSGGAGLERTEGRLIGIGGRLVLPGYRLTVRATGVGGHLDAVDDAGEARDVGEASLSAGWMARPWLTVEGDVIVRGYATPLARQRWTLMRIGGAARAPFFDGRLHALARLGIAPVASVSGLAGPRLPVHAASGLELAAGRFEGAMVYALERFDFPRAGMSMRREQLATLTFRAGWRFTGPGTP